MTDRPYKMFLMTFYLVIKNMNGCVSCLHRLDTLNVEIFHGPVHYLSLIVLVKLLCLFRIRSGSNRYIAMQCVCAVNFIGPHLDV